MGLTNIIDSRKRPYRFKKVNAVLEPTCHDNSVTDADQVDGGYPGVGYDEKEHITVASAIAWACLHEAAVTLYLYDEDDGIYEVGDKMLKGK